MPETAITTILNHQSTGKLSADPLLTPDQAANYLDVTKQTLAVWRCTRRYGIPYIKVGRLVKYRKSALDAFLDDRTRG